MLTGGESERKQAKMPPLALIWAFAWATVSANVSAANELVSVGEVIAERGETASGFLSFAGSTSRGVDIPVTIINGAGNGPLLALIAGVHGMETAPQAALHRIRREIDPADISGAIIIVHRVNVESFRQRTAYLNPLDGKNMNRVFPGNVQGSMSERAAAAITHHVIDQADYLVDMHAGDANEDLAPYVYVPMTGDREQDVSTIALARAFGVGRYLPIDISTTDFEAPIFLDFTAAVRGVTTITTETGSRGEAASWAVDLASNGVRGVLAHLGMTNKGPYLEQTAEVWLSAAEIFPAPKNGFFAASVTSGAEVQEGDEIGRLFDPFGDVIAIVSAPFDGWVNYVIATPPANEGDPLAMISRFGTPPLD